MRAYTLNLLEIMPSSANGEAQNVDAFVESDPAEQGFSTRPYPIIEQATQT